MPKRAMWVWTRPHQDTLIAFALRHSVQDLFLSVPDRLPSSTDLTWVRSVATAAYATPIRLYALGGDAGWLEAPARAAAWQQAALSTGLFTGSHVDLEPWGTPRWGTDRAAVVADYLTTLDTLIEATSLPLEADITHWLHSIRTGDGQRLDEAVLDRVTRVTVMSYRNTVSGPDSITGVGWPTLEAATDAGSDARLAVETNYLGDDPLSRKQTFHGQSSTSLTSAMRAVDELAATVPGYAGVSVHDYAGWSVMP